MLIICFGTAFYPAVALAYEEAELDLMTRRPRKITDHLVTVHLLTQSYLQLGQIATAGGFFTYFLIMQVYGFNYQNIFYLLDVTAAVPLVNPQQGDYSQNYNANTYYEFKPNVPLFNNPYLPMDTSKYVGVEEYFPSWVYPTNNNLDLRGILVSPCSASTIYCQNVSWPSDVLNTISPITNHPVAYTTEALFYAQSGYFATIVLVQWSSIFACKSRKVCLIRFSFPLFIRIGTNIFSVVFCWKHAY